MRKKIEGQAKGSGEGREGEKMHQRGREDSFEIGEEEEVMNTCACTKLDGLG